MFGFISQSPYKLILVLAIIGSISGFIVYYDNQRYQSGYRAAQVEMYEANEKAIQMAVAKKEEELWVAIIKAEDTAERALMDSQALRDKPQEIKTVEVIKVVESLGCKDFGEPFTQLLNSTIEKESEP